MIRSDVNTILDKGMIAPLGGLHLFQKGIDFSQSHRIWWQILKRRNSMKVSYDSRKITGRTQKQRTRDKHTGDAYQVKHQDLS
jgi:hypothetical protein